MQSRNVVKMLSQLEENAKFMAKQSPLNLGNDLYPELNKKLYFEFDE